MEKVGAGELDISLTRAGNDEFGHMATRFNEMVLGLKERMKLSQYVSRSTVAAVKDSVGSGASGHAVERRHCTLFFSDIRGFTTYSESRDPAQVVSTLNKVLSLQAEIVRRSGGDVDKFVGDEVMAVFPEVLPALEAAFEIQKAMASRRAELDGLAIGIGIHDGNVVQGDVGSDDIRNYTVIGDAVNTAARLESQARAGEILVSESAATRADSQARFAFEERGELKLKGKEIPIRTFSVKGRKRERETTKD
jgi:adenylate cyclase